MISAGIDDDSYFEVFIFRELGNYTLYFVSLMCPELTINVYPFDRSSFMSHIFTRAYVCQNAVFIPMLFSS